MKDYSRKFLIIKNLLRKYNKIMSDVQYQYGDKVIFDVDSYEYDMVLSIDIILSNLLKNGIITDIEYSIVTMFKDGYTYEEIGNTIGLSRQVVSKKLNNVISLVEEKFEE